MPLGYSNSGEWKRPNDCCNLCRYASDCQVGMPCGKWFPDCHKEQCGRCTHFIPFNTDPPNFINYQFGGQPD